MIDKSAVASLAGFFVTSPMLTECQNTAALRATFDALNAIAKSSCASFNASNFERGLAAFINGPASDLGRWANAIGANNIGVSSIPQLLFDNVRVESRSLLSVITLYSNAGEKI